MGDRTFSTFQDNLTFELGERSDISTYVDDWINTAYMTLTTKSRFPELRLNYVFPELETDTTSDTTDGTAYISKPTDCLFVRTLWDSDSDTKLIKIAWHDYLEKPGRADTDAEGAPTKWCTHGSNIYLYPTPDDTYTMYIYYRKRVAALSNDADTTAIGAEWDEVIQRLAKVQSLMRFGEYEYANQERTELTSMIKDIVGLYRQEELDRDDIRKPHPAYATLGKR